MSPRTKMLFYAVAVICVASLILNVVQFLSNSHADKEKEVNERVSTVAEPEKDSLPGNETYQLDKTKK